MNCKNCLNMKGVLITGPVSRDIYFTCKEGVHINQFGNNKRFKKSAPMKLMLSRISWNVGICDGFDSMDEYNGKPDPCVNCEIPVEEMTCVKCREVD